MDRFYYQQPRAEMLPLIPQRRRKILDIGCAEGTFIKSIERVEEAWGIEPDPQAAKIASERLYKVLSGTFDAVRKDLPLKYFDVIICNDVIEHIPNHDKFLSDIHEYLAPGGSLVGSVPNIRHYRNLFNLLVVKDWKYENDGTLDRTHLRFFTEKSLRRTLIHNGFTINEFREINNRLAWRWSKRDFVCSLSVTFAIVLTFGYFKDIRCLQFAFRASPTSNTKQDARPQFSEEKSR
jgi:2-polyprenyl-3-methyl-5-hydroxy-6-metoxy-1,4-benzoquinol methylase